MTTIKDTFTGQYLRGYDPDAFDGRGLADWTPDRADAMEFPDVLAAITLYRTVSKVRPTRHDGKPNRPLTAFTVTIE